MTQLSRYVLETLWENGDFVLSRSTGAECLRPFTPPNPAAWAWGSRSVARLWKIMAGDCGPCPTMDPAQPSSLRS